MTSAAERLLTHRSPIRKVVCLLAVVVLSLSAWSSVNLLIALSASLPVPPVVDAKEEDRQEAPVVASPHTSFGTVVARDVQRQEIPEENAAVDGALYNVSGSGFISTLKWGGDCWYHVTNFCVVRGDLVLYHDPATSSARGGSLRMCNEFSRHSALIRLGYRSEPAPAVLPGPLLTLTKGWILQFWCMDLFHMTLSLLPAFHTKSLLGPHPDIYIRIAKGKRHKSSYCRIKLGSPESYSVVQNSRWGGDRQFPFAGNPYWPFYESISPDPWRIHPLYGGATSKIACYRSGVVDKSYVKHMTGAHAVNYTAALRTVMGVPSPVERKCGSAYRLTFIDRRGKTRRLTNTLHLVEQINHHWSGKVNATPVALETLPIRQQLQLMTNTDILMGMHGNGITWLQFLQPGGVVVELIGVWYMPYAKLWGLKHFHSKMANNMIFKQQGEFVPFAHNESEVMDLVAEAVAHLDAVTCDRRDAAVPSPQRLEMLYAECAPHC